MKPTRYMPQALGLILLLCTGALCQSSRTSELPKVTAPPESFFALINAGGRKVQDPDITPHRKFYKKYIDIHGVPVVAAQEVDDRALQRTYEIVTHMLAGRPDILKAIIAEGAKLVVLGRRERIVDLPEYKRLAGKDGIDALALYLDYTPEMKLLVVAEENVLADPRDMYVGDSQVVRVFARAIHRIVGTRPVDPAFSNKGRNVQQYELRVERLDQRFDTKLEEIFEKALAAGKWKGTSAVHDRVQYWTAGVLAYFDALGQDGAPSDAPYPMRTRELLQQYDPDLFALVQETMAYGGKVDWRYVSYRR